MDAQSPDAWKHFVESGMDSEFFLSLNQEEQRDVEMWKSKRMELLRTYIQQEVEAKMEDEPCLVRDVTPVVRVLVRSFDYHLFHAQHSASRPTTEEAILSLWSPTEEQMSLLQEGTVLQIKNLAVRNDIREGRVQLSANSRTKIGILPSALEKYNLLPPGYKERKFTPFFRLHVASRKLLTSQSFYSVEECDVVGVVLKVVEHSDAKDRNRCVYLTDESNLVVRAHCKDSDLADVFGLTRTEESQTGLVCENPTLVAFRDMRVLPFDEIENCAVLEFLDRSSSHLPQRHQKVETLQQWADSPAGKTKLRKVTSYLDAGLYSMQRSQSDFATAIGYITGFSSSWTSSHQLRIAVDCGMPQCHEFELPFDLLKDVMNAAASSESVSTTATEDEGVVSRLTHLGKFYRARGVLYKFILKRKSRIVQKGGTTSPVEYEVCQVHLADMESIAGVFLAASADLLYRSSHDTGKEN